MRNNDDVMELMERLLNKLMRGYYSKRKYGPYLLSRAELHTVVAIGKNPGINLISLANLKGVTRSAASQMIYKLVKKGLVIKKVSEHSDKEIQLCLTSEGTIVYEKHQEYHRNNRTNIGLILDQLSDENYEGFVKMINMYDKMVE